MTTSELIPSVSIAAFLNAREGIRQRLETIHALIQETEAMAQQAGFGRVLQPRVYKEVGEFDPSSFVTPDGLNPTLHQMDVRGWKHLMNQTGLYSFFDRTAREDWRERIEKGDVPPLSVDTIAGVFGALHQDRRNMMERGVVEVFKHLSWDFKSNQPVKISPKIVLTDILDFRGGVKNSPRDTLYFLDDLVRALHWIEGTAEPDHRKDIWTEVRGAGTYDFPFFIMTVYKKGTGHITFKNPTLVGGLNQILAKHYPGALPAPR